jgi:hypothetical protein
MEYIIEKLSDLEIIKITISGKLNQDIRKELLLQAVRIINTNGYQKLLIDATGSKVSKNDTARTIHTFDMVDSIKKIETKNHIQIAILNKDREDDGRKDFVKLAQLMGEVHMKHFKNYDEAITWLLGGKDIFT